jgi:hypothetical protein
MIKAAQNFELLLFRPQERLTLACVLTAIYRIKLKPEVLLLPPKGLLQQ